MAKRHPADEAAAQRIDAQRKYWGKAENLVITVGCVLLFFGLLLLFFILPKKEYSKTENDSLSKFPSFSFESLKEGKFTEDIVEYLKDHFPLRDEFIMLNAVGDLAEGRRGSGGVLLGKDGYLLYDEHYATEEELKKLNKKKRAIDLIAGSVPTVVASAGKGSEVLTNKYPTGIDLSAITSSNRAQVNDKLRDGAYTYLDLAELLCAHTDEEIYYRTDHHWTTLGAYYASCAVLTQLGIEPPALSDFTAEVILENFKGTLYNRSGMFFHAGEKLTLLRYEGDDAYTVSLCDLIEQPSGGHTEKVLKETNSLYDYAALEDDYIGTAYDVFVAPVSVPVVRIEKSGEERPTLIVLKDSFAHSMLPFLARYFNIVSIDLRENADYAKELLDRGEADALLIIANTETLLS